MSSSAALRDAAGQAGLETSALSGAGVGSPGAIDADAGTVSSAGNLPGWKGSFALGPALEAELGTPVMIGNDVTVATEAEFRLGAGTTVPFAARRVLGHGRRRRPDPRAQAVARTRILRRDRSHGRQDRRRALRVRSRWLPRGLRRTRARWRIGARKQVDQGRRTDLFKLMKERGRSRLTSGVWAKAIERQDKLAMEIVDTAIGALGAAVASAVNLLDIEAVVIGGGLGVRFGQPYADRILDAMRPHLFVDENPPRVHVAELGDLGGAIGAALLARRAAR